MIIHHDSNGDYAQSLQAAIESSRRKASSGSSGTDPIAGDRAAGVVEAEAEVEKADIDLATRYLGLELRSPIVASAGPLQQSVDGIKQLADAGAGAVVMYSLFEEQIRHEALAEEQLREEHEQSFAEAMTYFPTVTSAEMGKSRQYLKLLEDAANAIDVPLIASINGSRPGSWIETAKRMQDCGAAAIELNIYYVPGDVQVSGPDVEQRHIDIVTQMKDTVSIPVSVKVGPYFSSFGDFARRLDQAGADGLVLFNRFLQPDIDLETTTVESGMVLSSPLEGRLPRAWISLLRGRIDASLALTSGVETGDDVTKAILAGADVVMTTSALIRHGIDYLGDLEKGLTSYLQRNELTLDKARGLLVVPSDAAADEYERYGYLSSIEKGKAHYGAA